MSGRPRRGFTVTELLVIIGVIILLLGLLFPALGAFRRSGLMTRSMSNLRQIGAWMSLYSGDNRDLVVPSQFNYTEASYPGKVRSVIQRNPLPIGQEHAGTWADILWTVNGLGPIPEAGASDVVKHDYEFDSPDGTFARWAEAALPSYENPLRSAAVNSRDFRSAHDLATPYGPGAGEAGLPGYFAANNFFNADPDAYDWRDPNRTIPDAWWSGSQVRRPERSMYLVDSFAGEIIQPWEERWEVLPPTAPGETPEPSEARIDFRYNDSCLMLFLDTHIDPVQRWDTIEDLEEPGGLDVRVRNLDQR